MAGEVQQGIGRAASVLAAIGASTNGLPRASDIARAIGLGASTTARLLSTLEELGYVEKVGDTPCYTIGPTVLLLASQGLNQNPIHRESRAHAQELAQRTGLSANVTVREGALSMYLLHFEGERARKAHTMVGMNQPLHATAPGKCLLLGTTPEQRAELFDEPLPAYTVNTITALDALTAELARVQARGAAIEDQELALGRVCVAAPIRDSDGHVAAAISLSGRATAMREAGIEALIDEVIEAADRISVGLGLISAVAT